MATAQGLNVAGMKKSNREDQMLNGDGWIEDVVGGSGSGVAPRHRLVARTAWLFSREDLDQAFDHLFIDEAGQVSLANVVSMGTAARNIVLVGDQMQLSQPIQGTHPGGSGIPTLDHLLEGHATVPRDHGYDFVIGGESSDIPCYFVPITIIDDPPEHSRIVQEEQFGPVLPLLRFSEVGDVIAHANASEYGLGALVWSSDADAARAVAERIASGTVWVNEAKHLTPLTAFGGMKQSGVGVENGADCLLEYTSVQPIARRRYGAGRAVPRVAAYRPWSSHHDVVRAPACGSHPVPIRSASSVHPPSPGGGGKIWTSSNMLPGPGVCRVRRHRR